MRINETTMRADELAELLKTYGSMPVAIQVIATRDGAEVAAEESDEGVHCEINTDRDGRRYLAIVGFREE